MKIIFFGTPSFVVPILENLVKHFEVVAVITTPDRKAGRKQQLTASPIKVFAENHNIPVLQPEKWSNVIIKQLNNYKADLSIVASYGKLLPQEVFIATTHGAINIHPSLLPKYRGASPIQTTILNGDTESGITFIKMDQQMDHGSILETIPYKIMSTDTADSLLKAMFLQSAMSLPDVIDRYVSGEIKPVPQADSQASYTKQFTKQDGFIDLDNPPESTKLDRMIRAFYPWPTVWTTVKINNKELKLKFLPSNKFQLEGKKPVNKKDLLNGYPQLGQLLEKFML